MLFTLAAEEPVMLVFIVFIFPKDPKEEKVPSDNGFLLTAKSMATLDLVRVLPKKPQMRTTVSLVEISFLFDHFLLQMGGCWGILLFLMLHQ